MRKTSPPAVSGSIGHHSCPVCGSFGSLPDVAVVVSFGGSVDFLSVVIRAAVVTVVVAVVVVVVAEVVVVVVAVPVPPSVLREGL